MKNMKNNKNHPTEVKFGKTGVIANKFGNARLNKLVGYKKIFKRIFIGQKSYRSKPHSFGKLY